MPVGGWSLIFKFTDSEESEGEEERELGPVPEKPELTRCTIDQNTLEEIQHGFDASPYDALSTLVGNVKQYKFFVAHKKKPPLHLPWERS
jgi:hypothetical protein